MDAWQLAFPEAADLLMQAGKYFYDQADYPQAEALFQRSLDISERVLGPDHPATAITLDNLAGLYQAMRKPEQAEALYQRALKLGKKEA